MTNRRDVLALGILGGATLLGHGPAAAQRPPADPSVAAMAALADRYAAAVNAHDTSSFPDIHAEADIQHSGRSPSGLAAQIALFKRIFAAMPDLRMVVEDRIIAGDKIVTRNSFSATHTSPIRGIPPTGKSFTFHTIDIWRVEKASSPSTGTSPTRWRS